MQFKLCWIWLQQVRVWLLSQRLRTGKNPDSQQFPQVVSRGEGSIHEVHQHAKILHKRSRGDFDPIWREQQKRHGQQRPNSTISANMTCSRGFEPSWWNCEGQILWYCYVICTTEQTNPFPEKDVWPNEQETWFGTDHWEGKGRKRKKTGIYEDISNQTRSQLCSPVWNFRPATLWQIVKLQTFWKATPVQRPAIVCQMSTPYITRFT